MPFRAPLDGLCLSPLTTFDYKLSAPIRHTIANLEQIGLVLVESGPCPLYRSAIPIQWKSRGKPLSNSRAFLSSPLAIAVVAFAVRVAFLFVTFHGQPAPAGNNYLIGGEVGSIAASLASGHGFSSPLAAASGPTAWTTPVFPLILAGFFKIFGIFSWQASMAIRLLNIVFASLTCYPVFLLGRRLFGDATGITASWLWALLPKAIYFPVMWVWDTSLSALFLCLCLLATYAVEKYPNPRTWAGYGALCGVATLVNAAALSVFPGCLLFAAFRARRLGAKWVSLCATAVAGFLLTLSPWIIRNQVAFHGQVLLRSNFGLELWLGNNPEVPVSWSWWLHPTESAKEKADFLRLGEVAYMQQKKAIAIEFIKSHPADTLRFQYHRFMETWTGFGEPFLDIWRGAKPSLRSELLVNYSLTALMFLGLLYAHRQHPLESIPFINVIALFPAVYYVTHTTSRYRHPIDPIITLLAAYAMVSIVSSARDRITSLRGKRRVEPAHLE
jgi:4-amino-4-deoxy-L-arabinose transferase-like glycosyltransferase